ncbi:hypothetical protein [Xanthomonas arboricola]|uniref:hypothetical protein n=1 Tax=Xanthomonas arboricola TaxID=56448 RepID=UPI003EB83263
MKVTTTVLIAVFCAVAVSGCASTKNHTVQSNDQNLIFIGEDAPAGYPKTYVRKNGPSCESVTESWVKDKEPVSRKTMWRKIVERTTVTCE